MSNGRPDHGAGEEPTEEPPPMPFSFKLVVVLGGLYLLWRAVQLVLCLPSLFSGQDCPFL
ncbi:MAG: hypothetical protein AB1Z57_02495 [Acidimicrobiia bacterium]